MSKKRKKLSRRGSKRLFSSTGSRIERKNIAPPPMRGGIRL